MRNIEIRETPGHEIAEGLSPGEHLQQILTKAHLSEQRLAELSGIPPDTLKRYKKTSHLPESHKPNLERFLHRADIFDLRSARALREMLEKGEEIDEKAWLHTISTVPFALSLRLLRLTDNYSQREFAERVQLSTERLGLYETGERAPYPHNLNTIIARSVLGSDDPMPLTYPAQLLRIKNPFYQKRAKIPKKYPLSIDALQHISFAELFAYANRILGLSEREMDRYSNMPPNTSHKILNNHFRRDPDILENLVGALCLSPEDPMKEILARKAHSFPIAITDETRKKLMSGRVLFAEHLEQTGSQPPLSQSDQALLQVIHQKNTIEIMTDLGRRELYHPTKIHHDLLTIKTLRDNGYGIHHPVTHALLMKAVEERRKK